MLFTVLLIKRLAFSVLRSASCAFFPASCIQHLASYKQRLVYFLSKLFEIKCTFYWILTQLSSIVLSLFNLNEIGIKIFLIAHYLEKKTHNKNWGAYEKYLTGGTKLQIAHCSRNNNLTNFDLSSNYRSTLWRHQLWGLQRLFQEVYSQAVGLSMPWQPGLRSHQAPPQPLSVLPSAKMSGNGHA